MNGAERDGGRVRDNLIGRHALMLKPPQMPGVRTMRPGATNLIQYDLGC